MHDSSNRKKMPSPITNGFGGKKFFLPRMMKEPFVKYSPLGAVFDTWWASTHHADVTMFESLPSGHQS